MSNTLHIFLLTQVSRALVSAHIKERETFVRVRGSTFEPLTFQLVSPQTNEPTKPQARQTWAQNLRADRSSVARLFCGSRPSVRPCWQHKSRKRGEGKKNRLQWLDPDQTASIKDDVSLYAHCQLLLYMYLSICSACRICTERTAAGVYLSVSFTQWWQKRPCHDSMCSSGMREVKHCRRTQGVKRPIHPSIYPSCPVVFCLPLSFSPFTPSQYIPINVKHSQYQD